MEAWLSVSPGKPGGPCPMYNSPQRKDSGWARVSAKSRASDSRQGQSTSMEKWFYKGPLNWLPDRCCLMEGLVLAASPSFLQTTCEEAHSVSAGLIPTHPLASHTYYLTALREITHGKDEAIGRASAGTWPLPISTVMPDPQNRSLRHVISSLKMPSGVHRLRSQHEVMPPRASHPV